MIDRGQGVPVVVVPGIQGRWEWTAPTITALAARLRVIAFSFCDEPSSGEAFDAALGFDNYVDQVRQALDRAGVERAIIIGVSFGGLVASEFAARHPDRVLGLVFASALSSGWRPDRRARFYLKAPLALSPLFCIGAPARMYPEIAAAYPALGPRLKFLAAHGHRVLRAFLSPTRMARRLQWALAHVFSTAIDPETPTLIVTGEASLDRVVPTEVTARCADGLRDVQWAVLPQTGHLGIVTRAEPFAAMVERFAAHAVERQTVPVQVGRR